MKEEKEQKQREARLAKQIEYKNKINQMYEVHTKFCQGGHKTVEVDQLDKSNTSNMHYRKGGCKTVEVEDIDENIH